MKTTLALLSFLALAASSSSLTACAAPTDDEGTGATEDDLRALKPSEIVGSVATDGEWHEVDALDFHGKSGYRALSFTAQAGDDITADVVVLNASDPVGYILGADFATLAHNDDADATTTDSRVHTKVKKTGTYYVAFKNKQKWGAKYEVKVTRKASAAPVDFHQGWPVAANGYAVRIESATSHGEINGTGCPAAPPAGTDLGAGAFSCTVDLEASTIGCKAATQILGAAGTIAADGSFAIDASSSSWSADYTEVRGHLEPEGKVVVDSASFMACQTNSSDQRVFYSYGLENGAGTAVAR